MTVAELIERLKTFEPTATVEIEQMYETGGSTDVIGFLFNKDAVTLTDEEK